MPVAYRLKRVFSNYCFGLYNLYKVDKKKQARAAFCVLHCLRAALFAVYNIAQSGGLVIIIYFLHYYVSSPTNEAKRSESSPHFCAHVCVSHAIQRQIGIAKSVTYYLLGFKYKTEPTSLYIPPYPRKIEVENALLV
jgi:hypothetical protein